MKYNEKNWGEAELSEQWSLTSEEHDLISSHPEKNWLGLAAQLKYLQIEGCFPRKLPDIPKPAREYLAQQLSTPISGIKNIIGKAVAAHGIAGIFVHSSDTALQSLTMRKIL